MNLDSLDWLGWHYFADQALGKGHFSVGGQEATLKLGLIEKLPIDVNVVLVPGREGGREGGREVGREGGKGRSSVMHR